MFNTVSPLTRIPSQMISYAEKVRKKKKWAKESLDAFEQQGRQQLRDNLRFAENYQMLNGKFMMHHYMDSPDTKNLIDLLSKEFEVPSTLRHYDIIGKLINNLTEKLADFPDVFRIQEMYEEDENNEYVREKTDQLHKSVKSDINNEIKQRLLREGIDVDKTDFESEEQAMQYFQEVQQMATAMQPPQIEKYMNTNWQGSAEKWGQHQMELDKLRFKLGSLERKEFRDMLVTDRCFRHFYITGDGYQQETWNPLYTFYHISPEVEWAEDGNYIGRQIFMTKNDILERWGWKLDEKATKKLEELDQETNNELDRTGFPHNVYAPFPDFKSYSVITAATGYDPINQLPMAQPDELSLAAGNESFTNRQGGLYRVTEVYWKSMKKIGKVIYTDEETGRIVKELVDENFIVPDYFVEKKGDFYVGNDQNTVYWTWVNQTWQGVKIAATINDSEAIYLDLKPCEFQFKGDYNPYGAKLPVCGRVFNNRNAQSMSFVDQAKPHQIGHNMMMNQLYQLAEREEGKFMVWDAKFFNNLKDWGGEESFGKINLILKEFGHVFGDTSPETMGSANPSSGLPKVMDMDLTAQLFSRAKLAEFFESRLLGQLGISQQYMADVNATDTATGVKTAVTQSQVNVQRYYTEFFEYKQHCLTMNLDIAQYVQSLKKDITISYTKDDASRVFLKMAGTDLLLRNMHVYVVNSQELLKQLELIRELFIRNNTTQATELDLVEVITNNSPAAIKAHLKTMVQNRDAKEQAAQQQQVELQDKALQLEAHKEDREDARLAATNETKKEVAYIANFNKTPTADNNANSIPDSLEYSKMADQQATNSAKISEQHEKNQITRTKNTLDAQIKQKDLKIKEKALQVKAKESRDKVKIAVKNKNYKDK